jgi:metabolite-proton symporter
MADTGKTPLRRVVMASLIGTTVEWYDFFLYGSAAALVFNKLFFPEFDPLTGTLLAFATYALGFVARPVGGIVFGHFGDRIGRKRLLMLSLVLMGVATVLIGLLPTYAQIGIWAPLALIALRLVQGFAVGGEWGGAVLMAAEHGDAARRGFWASWPQAGVPAGNLLAAAVLAIMAAFQTEADFLAWGWRVPFVLSALLVVVGWYIRNRVSESPMFEKELDEAEAPPKVPAMEVLRERPKALVLGAGLRVGENISYYILTVFSLTYLVDVSHESRSLALNALLIGAAVQFFAIPGFALLSDRIGRRPVYALGAFGLAAWCFIMFGLLGSGDNALIVLALVIGLVLHGAMYGPQAAFITELFPTRIRYSGVSLAYQLTSIVAGSLAPIIALWLYKEYDSATPVAIYVGAACLISGVSALLARETRGLELEAIR